MYHQFPVIQFTLSRLQHHSVIVNAMRVLKIRERKTCPLKAGLRLPHWLSCAFAVTFLRSWWWWWWYILWWSVFCPFLTWWIEKSKKVIFRTLLVGFNLPSFRSPKNLNNTTKSELSAGGAKQDVKKTQKCNCLNRILAPWSRPP